MKVRRLSREKPAEDGKAKPRRSRHADAAPRRVAVLTVDGRIVGEQMEDGTVVDRGECCADPLHCERPECWRRVA